MTKDIERTNTKIAQKSVNDDIELLAPVKKTNHFINFRYSYKSVSSIGGRTHIKSKQKSLENGKFESEEFEATVDGNVYSDIAGKMQESIWRKVAAFLKPLGLAGRDKRGPSD